MHIRAILARREAIRTELKSILEKHGDSPLPDDVRAHADELEAEATQLNDRERRQTLLDDLDRRSVGQPLGDGGDASFDTAASKVSILDVLRSASGATDRAAGMAKEISDEIARRSGRQPTGIYWDSRLSTSLARARMEQRVFGTLIPASGPGGALVQTSVLPQPVDLLTPKLIVARLGATTISGLVGNLAIPRIKQWPSTFWVSENSPLTASDPATEQITFSPKHVGAVTELTRQLMMQATPDAVTLVESIFTGAVAQAIDQAALVGGGSSQPVGILGAGSTVPVLPGATNGLAPSWNNLVAMVAAVDQSNALENRLGWAGNARVTSILRRTLRSTGDTSSNWIMGDDPNTLLGYPYQSSQNVPSNGSKGTGTNLSSLVFGDWSAVTIGYWSALDIALNTQGDSVFLKGNCQIRTMATLDVQLRHANALVAMTDLITT
jgi:HK97 family phage major capsid protein